MPSQEDKRDKFTDMVAEGDGREALPREEQALDIDAVSEMSQEEIERLLSKGAEEVQPLSTDSADEMDADQEDVIDMLEDSEDDNLWDIQDMLKKSDRNEAIGEAEEDSPNGEGPADKLLADIEEENGQEILDGKARKAMEKQRKAEEKARQREEKAAKKKAAKEAAKAGKAGKRGLKKDRKKGLAESEGPDDKERKEIEEYDMLLDKELLDTIVSDAGNLGREEGPETVRAAQDAFPDSIPDGPGERPEINGMEGDSSMDREDVPGNASEMDIMEVDMDEVDALIPDISDSVGEEKGGKKKGFMSKLITLLTEEDEPENEDIPLSEENQGIIRDLDEEANQGGKGKKPAKKKAKKPAKKKEKKKKAPKPKKPKAPKKPKEADNYVPGKKITFKKALPILLLGATIGAVTFIFVFLVTDFSVRKSALEAYDQGDYQTCYQNLYGKELSEEEAEAYAQSECVLYMRQMYRKYELFMGQSSEMEALDSLIQTVGGFPAVMAYASQWEVLPEVGEVYSAILGILQDKYGITEEQAQTIAAVESRIEYTRTITALVEGKGYGKGSEQAELPQEESDGEQPGTALPDELPEESGLEEGNFVDN